MLAVNPARHARLRLRVAPRRFAVAFGQGLTAPRPAGRLPPCLDGEDRPGSRRTLQYNQRGGRLLDAAPGLLFGAD